MKTTTGVQTMKIGNERNQAVMRFAAFTVIFFFLMNNELLAQSGGVAAKIAAMQSWIKPLVHAILGLLCLFKLCQVVYKFFFAQREAGGDFVWLIGGLIVWGAFATFANEIFNLAGGTGTAVN